MSPAITKKSFKFQFLFCTVCLHYASNFVIECKIITVVTDYPTQLPVQTLNNICESEDYFLTLAIVV